MKDRKVSFDRKEMVSNTNIGDVAHSSSDDSIITGRVVKLGPITNMMKYDNASQQKVEKSYRTAVIGDATGAVLAMLWEEIAKSVSGLAIVQRVYLVNRFTNSNASH